MKVSTIKQDAVTIVTIEGRLDTTNSKEFDQELQPLLTEKNLNLVVNCKKMNYISSSGLRIFMTLLKAVKANNGTLALENMDTEVKNVFDMTGFSNIFTLR